MNDSTPAKIFCIAVAVLLPLAGLSADPSTDFPASKPASKPAPAPAKKKAAASTTGADPASDFPSRAQVKNGKPKPPPVIVPDFPPVIEDPEPPRVVAQVAEPPWTIADAIAAAHADLMRQPAELRVLIRYLDIGHYPPGKQEFGRGWWREVLSGHCNQLSRGEEIVKPVPVASGRLLRINIGDYHWEGAKGPWEQLEDQDPDFHVKAVAEEAIFETVTRIEIRQWPLNKPWTDGKIYQKPFTYEHKIVEQRQVGKKSKTLLTGFSADLNPVKKELLELVAAMQTQVPLARGDWLLWISGQEDDRGRSGYYSFLQVKDRADYDKLVGFDAKALENAKIVELLEAVSASGVSKEPRRIGVFKTLRDLRKYTTFDNEKAIDKANPLTVLDKENFTHKAEEHFSSLPNGLWAFLLCDDKGALQASAPDFIGYDHKSHGNSGKIHVGLSCIRCHYQHDGLMPVDAWARNLFNPPPLRLQAVEYAKLRELKALYLRDLEGPMADDRRTFRRTLKIATGMTPPEFAVAYSAAFASYDGPVNLERAARTLGVTPKHMQVAFSNYLTKTGGIDLILGNYLLPADRQRAIGINQFTERITLAREIIRGYR